MKGSNDQRNVKLKAINAWVVCAECGKKHGRNPDGIGGYQGRKGTCGICDKRTVVFDFKNYGFAKY